MTSSKPDEKAIFSAARRIPAPDARRQYIEEACAGDRELQARIEALLCVFDENRSFLQTPHEAARSAVETPFGTGPGTVIGPYKLIEQIGEGGMGTVFLAEQTEPVQRQVALKVIKPGMDSRQVIARFEAERQALAVMDHPNIAKVFDAGTIPSPPVATGGLSGRPYFVMELVQGTSITRYCDEHHLTPKERLELFIPVCLAVQHAHQKGIIHRDLKPSNVLIAAYDGRPVPKIIDFGVAKATGPQMTVGPLTAEFGAVLGTLEYMSPEQAQPGLLDIDTRSDIYSLGVLLYELLTGTTPLDRKRFKEAAVFEWLRMIREEEPPKPSTRLSASDELPSIAANRGLEPKKLSRLFRGDLDWIVMRSLEKDRSRRYGTASGLARDIERFLNDEPVEAGPPSASYRFRKFLRRNRGPVIAATFFLLALVGGIIGTSIGLYRADQEQKAAVQGRQLADRQRDRAERHYHRALSAVDRLLTRVGATGLAPVPHMDETRRRLLEDALEFYRGFLTDETDDPVVRREIGRAHGRIGNIQMELGRLDEAEAASHRAIEILRGLVAEDADNADYQLDLAQSQHQLAEVWSLLGRRSEAEKLIRDILSREPSVFLKFRREGSELHYLLGMICYHTRRPDEAEAAFHAALKLDEALPPNEPGDLDRHVARSSTLNMLGLLSRERQRLSEAEQYYSVAKEILDRIVSAERAEPDHRFRLSGIVTNLGLVYAAQDRRVEAEESHRKALVLMNRLVEDHPDRPEYKRFLANGHNNLALLYAKVGDKRRALEENETALKIHEELKQRYPRRLEFAVNYASACGNQAKYGSPHKMCNI